MDIIVGGPVDIATGHIVPPISGYIVDHLANHTQLSATASLIRTYVACKKFNAANPTINPPRYDPLMLAKWLTNADASVQKVALVLFWYLDPNLPTTQPPWGGTWQVYNSHLNDVYGYQGIDARQAYLALESLGTAITPAEATLRDRLKNDILINGAEYFVGLLEQSVARGAFNDGDQARSWPQFLHLAKIDYPNPTSPFTMRYGNALIEAAFNLQRFQYPDGIWTNGPLDWFHCVDTSGGYGGGLGAPVNYVGGMALALQVPWITAGQETKLWAALRQFQVTANSTFKRPYGYVRSALMPLEDSHAGLEWRTIQNYLTVLDLIDEKRVLSTPPSVATIPASLHPAPTVPQAFQFVLTVPTALTPLDLDNALNLRTKIDLWSYDVNNLWTKQNVWPAAPGSFTTTYISQTQIQQTYTNPALVAGIGKFKLATRTWDLNGRWTQDTSYQEW